jgi:hypothetical protein
LMPGMKITSIDGRTYSGDVLHEEIRAAKEATKAIDINAEQATFAGTFHVDYHGGERYPHLERIAGTVDVLTEIMRPHAK